MTFVRVLLDESSVSLEFQLPVNLSVFLCCLCASLYMYVCLNPCHYSSDWRVETLYCSARYRIHDNSSTDISSTTLRLQTFRLRTFRLLLYTRVQDSYTFNFCFRKSVISSI